MYMLLEAPPLHTVGKIFKSIDATTKNTERHMIENF